MKAADSKYCRCMYFSSNALARKVEKLAQESWKPVDLSPSHAYLLMLVIENPGIQPSALTTELLLTPSTITRLLDKLEEKKLIVRTSEGKTIGVHASAKAKTLLPELRKCLAHFYEAYCDILGKEESAQLVKQMNTVCDKLPV
jgi:MarR family transcriptional regulator, organic hydroperoxide resistance regulator